MEHSQHPTLHVLQAEDGSINHAITTLGDCFFDSNLQNAQRISKDTLDWSCQGNYVSAHHSVRLFPCKFSHLPHCGNNWKGIHFVLASFIEMLGELDLVMKVLQR